MPIQGNIREFYRPARIYPATTLNADHVRQPVFSDEQLGMPTAPVEPTLTSIESWIWTPAIWSIFPFIFLFFASTTLFFLIDVIVLMVLWSWAIAIKLPEYREWKLQNDLAYSQALSTYEAETIYFHKVILPEWQRRYRPQALKQKQYECRQTALDEVCQRKCWCTHSEAEIVESREHGYVGLGEDRLVCSLQSAGIFVRHQIVIDWYYTADMICFNPISGKLCVIEVDGAQHWSDSAQIRRDEQRMSSLASQGIPTIRFINTFAQNKPHECVKHIRRLLH